MYSLCVEHRAKKVGLQGNGVNLKLTYSDMHSISRSHSLTQTDNGVIIYREALKMLETVERHPVRLIGVGIYNLSADIIPEQLSFYDIKGDHLYDDKKAELLKRLQLRYGLDFSSNLDKIYQWDILHKTIEYMRKHKK